MTMIEPFGVDYVRPAPAPCPDCDCCSAALCERGRTSTFRCAGLAQEAHRALVYGCPCSSALTRGTHAWRLDRIRITRYATEYPLTPAIEVALRALARREVVDDLGALAWLRIGGLAVEPADEVFVVTELGEFYLKTRSAPRSPATVDVLSVDRRTRTAQCLVPLWREGEPVTVLLDQLLVETGLTAGQLPGMWLEAHVNHLAETADDVVLTRVTVPSPVPEEGAV
ncbi:hypothetical protein B0E38_04731 [Streptomyces sp. 111WW2]|uniref:hypothetical protein n=1 Tax=Streptomyces sp. 111WW2 TaxID=1945515 RepID=UPI000D0C854C|nr:hypothetical protein [Streptomyces sp. 111WW2]PSK52405.1 hypothetical protein B0E38_04731 [Streptomyces sp. 111WW2]